MTKLLESFSVVLTNMRAILNFLAMMVASLSSYLGGGDMSAKPVADAPKTVASAPVQQQPSLIPAINGALAALPVSNLVALQSMGKPEPVVVVRYVDRTPKQTKGAAKSVHEFPTREMFAMIPEPQRVRAEVAMKAAMAQAKLHELSISLPPDIEDDSQD